MCATAGPWRSEDKLQELLSPATLSVQRIEIMSTSWAANKLLRWADKGDQPKLALRKKSELANPENVLPISCQAERG